MDTSIETNPTELEQPFARPLSGAPVEQLPSGLIPSRSPLRGQNVELVAQDARLHAADLYAAGHDTEAGRRTSERRSHSGARRRLASG